MENRSRMPANRRVGGCGWNARMAEQQLIWGQCIADQRPVDCCDAGCRYRHLARCRAVPGEKIVADRICVCLEGA